VTAREDPQARTWLLAVDGSAGADYAAQYVAGVAKRLGVREIRVIHVRAHTGEPDAAQTPEAGDRGGGTAAPGPADNACRMLTAAGLDVRRDSPRGSEPAALIARAGRRGEIDEIVMGTRGVSALKNLALGSVAYKVLHLARVPVTLIPTVDAAASRRPSARTPLRVLLAADGSRASLHAVEYVCGLAAVCALDVHLLNVQPRIVSGNVRSFFSRAQIEEFHRDEGMAALRATIRQFESAGVKHRVEIRTGPMAETIVDAAHDHGCDRIVMGSRGLAAAGSVLLGSVTYGVVHRTDLPVTSVK